ncbi:MAG: NifB/NifX family molybdenum-iron cluster-binding protein [Dehalococcoidia bacterium]|nr:NifB/NifX family molybdenum-iron cluster-binding protein [Dehalococcoidia bacterium]RLC63208.1 MAG: ATPase [Chloroflexota bacterium]
MRFAVPVTEAKVADHFGHCTHFALFDVDEATKAIVKKEVIPSPGHQPGFLPAWLAEEGVSVVIASGMGSRARALFEENRIKVVVGVLGVDPEKVVLDYIKGELATGDNICDH